MRGERGWSRIEGGEEDLGEVEGGESVIRIYYVRKKFFSMKEEQNLILLEQNLPQSM